MVLIKKLIEELINIILFNSYFIRISYLDIFKIVELTCEKHQAELVTSPSLDEIIHYDLWARDYAANLQSPALV